MRRTLVFAAAPRLQLVAADTVRLLEPLLVTSTTDGTALQHTLTLTLSKVLRSTRHKIGHFGDTLPSQSLGLVLIKQHENPWGDPDPI